MSQSILFSTYLHDLMTKQKVSADHIQHELNYSTSIPVRSWLEGRARPPLSVLPALAVVLRTDPVALICGWVIDQLPEMETILRTEVLDPRGSTFPRSTDLTLRMPKPPKPIRLW
jgi:hypothetical protein